MQNMNEGSEGFDQNLNLRGLTDQPNVDQRRGVGRGGGELYTYYGFHMLVKAWFVV